MRRLVVMMAALAIAVGVGAPAGAAPSAASDFAADCADDALVHVTGMSRFVGGHGEIAGDCMIVFEPGATLVFRSVDIVGTGNIVAISSPELTTIKVIDSSIVAAGFLELTAGCCAGDAEVPEYAGTVVVNRSILSGAALQLLASFDWPRGRVLIRDSMLSSATGGIQVRASDLGGRKGTVRISDSTISSAGDVLIRTGAKGKTDTRRITFAATGAVEISTGAGGRCRASGHTPPTSCS